MRYKQLDQMSFADLEVYSVLPEHPVWSRAAELLDFSFADEICAPLYSTRGPKPYAPSLKLKLHIVQRYYNLSDREMEERVIGDLFIKRFLGLPVSFIGFDHSTIGLDQERMGSALFDACHHHILAQAKQKGLWGDNKDIWLVDSFHTNGHIARLSAYRLIKQAVLRVLSHLKRAHRVLYRQLGLELDLKLLIAKLPADPTPEDVTATFSRLVVLAYGLLHWFEKETIRPIFWSWQDRDRQLASLERQAILFRILTENTMPGDPDDPNDAFRKRPRKDRPANQLLSSVDPDARVSKKRSITYRGDKIQVVMSAANDMVLVAEPIAGNETDGDRLQELLDVVQQKHGVKPAIVVTDSAYGRGYHRRDLKIKGITFAAPLQGVSDNFTGLYSNENFSYDVEAGTVTCPAGQVTQKKSYNRKLEGTQYHFPKTTCLACRLREQCTASVHGRKVFISDYYDEFQEAKAFNETEQAKQLFQLRNSIERKNNELKNHNGLGHARTRTREKRRVYVKVVSMVVNLKQFVKQRNPLTLGFVRKRSSGFSLPILPAS
ncbi:transposase [Paenibacillus tyrfis]|uniref:transposase n=1 Tax=Paenibacillus tyrfis TaxID=1501230 RepID=UPI00249281D3|nr:transposase [Paenibacillus tyrfis]